MIKALSTAEEGGAIADISGILEQGQFQWGIVSSTGIVLKDETPETEWRRMTEHVAILFEAHGRKHAQAAMVMGDLLRWGEEHLGERYADVIDATREYMRSYGIHTIKNWMWIAGKIAPSRRRENLSLAHHEAVAKLEPSEQDEFLRLADDEGMTVKELKEAIRTRHPAKPRNTKPRAIVSVDVTIPQAVTDALQILANHLSNPETEILEDWKEHLAALHKVYRRHWQNGHAKKAA